jgi:hypothetical protein
MGERSAVRPKSGQSVRQSDPALRRPTPPSTAGRKPAARPSFQTNAPLALQGCAQSREAGLAQPKIGRGAGQSPAVSTQREALDSLVELPGPNTSSLETLDDSQTAILLEFFTLLDRWDREAHGN